MREGYGDATQSRNMGSMIGAMQLLLLYTTESAGLNLMANSTWRQAVKAAERLSRSVPADTGRGQRVAAPRGGRLER